MDHTQSRLGPEARGALSRIAPDRWTRLCLVGLLGLGLFWCVARLWGLENAPYGIWMDESRVALHTICVAQTGEPAGTEYWPWFAPAFGGGHHPSLLIYFDVAWTRLFGNSIASFRAADALFNLVAIAGLVLIARRLLGWPLAACTFLSAAISPWSFQFSRIAWEGPLGPAFQVFAVYFLLQRSRWYWAIAAGVCGGLAMFAYPPLRLATPLVLLFVGLLQWRRRAWRLRELALSSAALFVTFLPVLRMTLQGRISQRAMDVAIFSKHYLDDNRGSLSRAAFLCSRLLDNLLSHFRPSFLLFSGDENVRHSAHLVGQLSPLDALALIATVAWISAYVVRQLIAARAAVLEPNAYRRRLLLIMLAGLVGFVCGSVPAALTWDGEPHALRSIAAWPWACLAGASALTFWATKRPRIALPALLAGTALYTAYFIPAYFRVWKTLPDDPFRRDIREAIDSRGDKRALEVVRPWLHAYGGEQELRYYLIRWDEYDCKGSESALRQLRKRRRR